MYPAPFPVKKAPPRGLTAQLGQPQAYQPRQSVSSIAPTQVSGTTQAGQQVASAYAAPSLSPVLGGKAKDDVLGPGTGVYTPTGMVTNGGLTTQSDVLPTADAEAALINQALNLALQGGRDTTADQEALRREHEMQLQGQQRALAANMGRAGMGFSGALGAMDASARAKSAQDVAMGVLGIEGGARDEAMRNAELALGHGLNRDQFNEQQRINNMNYELAVQALGLDPEDGGGISGDDNVLTGTDTPEGTRGRLAQVRDDARTQNAFTQAGVGAATFAAGMAFPPLGAIMALPGVGPAIGEFVEGLLAQGKTPEQAYNSALLTFRRKIQDASGGLIGG
jgi:hypothetical protein